MIYPLRNNTVNSLVHRCCPWRDRKGSSRDRTQKQYGASGTPARRRYGKGATRESTAPPSFQPAPDRDPFGQRKAPSGRLGKYIRTTAVTLAQEFEVAGQRGMRIGLAVKNLTKIGYEVRDRERMVTYEVKDAFARALSLKEKEGLTRKVVGIQEELVNFTRIKYRAGSVSGLEVNLAEVGARQGPERPALHRPGA